jgi:hypothetical protein
MDFDWIRREVGGVTVEAHAFSQTDTCASEGAVGTRYLGAA